MSLAFINGNTGGGGGGGVTAHGALTGLGNDDHSQYLLLAGRAGGQVVNGGINSGDDLTLTSTSHATKGDLLLTNGTRQVNITGGNVSFPALNVDQGVSIATAGPLFNLCNSAANLILYVRTDTSRDPEMFGQANGGGTLWTLSSAGFLTTGFLRPGNTTDTTNGNIRHTGTDLEARISGAWVSLTASGGVTDHGALTGLGDDDHTQYSRADGTRAFTGTVSGVTPTINGHLATKGYVDGQVVTDHGALGGLGDDDHTQYSLANGTRAFSGTVSGVTPTAGAHLTTKDYVDNATTANFYYQEPILDQIDFTASEPGSPGVGDRYINTTTGNSSGTTQAMTATYIYEWNGATWTETVATEGMILYDDTLNRKLCFNGTAWVDAGAGTDHGALSGLGDDDHSQYLLLAGRAGGQTLIGGTAASENLTLSSTSNATKGVIVATDAVRIGNTTDTTNGNFRYTGTDFEVRLSGVWTSVTQSGITDHGLLSGLGDDDHTQYSLADGTRAFTGVVSGVTPTLNAHLATKGYVDGAIISDHGALSGLGDDDHSQYSLADGSRAFTGVVSGVTPTIAAHLATKGYVDGAIVTDHGALSGLGDDDHTQYSLADGTRAFTGVVSGVTPTLDAHLATKGYVDGASSAGIDPVMHLVTAGEVTAGFLTLATAPNTTAAISIDIVGGIKQVNKQIVGATGATPDYDVGVDGASTVSINNAGSATGLSGSIIAGNILIIQYVA